MYSLKIALFTILLLLLPGLSYSDTKIPCYIQFVKDNCWADYTVTLQLKDGVRQDNIATPIILAKNKLNTLQTFKCSPGEQITAVATFSPSIWKEDNASTYRIRTFWNVPATLPPKTDKWIIKLCFSKDFISVPIPITGSGHCECQFPETDTKPYNDTTAK